MSQIGTKNREAYLEEEKKAELKQFSELGVQSFFNQSKERQEEEHFRKLDSLIRQQQATRRESVKNSPVLRFKKRFT